MNEISRNLNPLRDKTAHQSLFQNFTLPICYFVNITRRLLSLHTQMSSKSQKTIEKDLKRALYLLKNISTEVSQIELRFIWNLPIDPRRKIFILSVVEGSPLNLIRSPKDLPQSGDFFIRKLSRNDNIAPYSKCYFDHAIPTERSDWRDLPQV